ncbi:hypothetical protein XENTR_v10017507 [Xenopus tropicalis]|nr:hypothetical protein XENTR_v10017507 [Xenopus tropicalis]
MCVCYREVSQCRGERESSVHEKCALSQMTCLRVGLPGRERGTLCPFGIRTGKCTSVRAANQNEAYQLFPSGTM